MARIESVITIVCYALILLIMINFQRVAHDDDVNLETNFSYC